MYKDITGKKFGRLLVLSRGERASGGYKWNCLCDCGKKISVLTSRLNAGVTKSCGCYAKDRVRESSFKHGGYINNRHTRLYQCWAAIKTRTTNKNDKEFKNYGGRGIKMCEMWANDFGSFKAWALENGYQNNLTIERKNVNGDYTPENCCWATRKEQAQNRRNTLKYKGIAITKLCELTGIKYRNLMRIVYFANKKGVPKESVFEKTFGNEILAQIQQYRKKD